uniref:G-protein coupled receptors family 1 profile domain-containing protein n=1 Tax=Oncorhynchus tshawytscha TaxID=74940 RepID=A0AAZ3RAJ5_ONCTS
YLDEPVPPHIAGTMVNPRTFRGEIIQLKSVSLPNATQQTQTQQAPHSSPLLSPSALTPPALRLLSNGTAAYLAGPLSTRVIPCVYVLAIVVGIPANVAILSAGATKVRTVSSTILYCSLAISDLFLLLSLIVKADYHLHGNHWMFGETACSVVTACFYGNLYCSAHTLACLSIKRYLAVGVHRLGQFGCVGMFGAAVIPKLLVRQSYRLPQLGLTTCHDVLPRDYSSHAPLLYYNMGLTILGLLVPLVVMAVCYTRIVRELNRSHHDWTLYVKASSLVFVIFVACFGPAATLLSYSLILNEDLEYKQATNRIRTVMDLSVNGTTSGLGSSSICDICLDLYVTLCCFFLFELETRWQKQDLSDNEQIVMSTTVSITVHCIPSRLELYCVCVCACVWTCIGVLLFTYKTSFVDQCLALSVHVI